MGNRALMSRANTSSTSSGTVPKPHLAWRRHTVGLLLAFRLGVLAFCALLLLGFIGALTEDSGTPAWIEIPLLWAAWGATFPGWVVAHSFSDVSPVPAWVVFAQGTVYLGSCVVCWTLIAWAGLWLYRLTGSRARK